MNIVTSIAGIPFSTQVVEVPATGWANLESLGCDMWRNERQRASFAYFRVPTGSTIELSTDKTLAAGAGLDISNGQICCFESVQEIEKFLLRGVAGTITITVILATLQ